MPVVTALRKGSAINIVNIPQQIHCFGSDLQRSTVELFPLIKTFSVAN